MLRENNYTEAVGCIHIHSTYSDGTGSIAEISKVAAELNLDYLMITDHNNLRALANGEERWYGSVLTVIGYEINDIDDTNHYLAFGLDEELNKNIPAPEYVRLVKQNGGFGIIAHPDEQRDAMLEHPPYPWTAWESKDYQGIEIWNQMSEWMEGLTPWNKLWRFVNPRKSIIAPTSQTLQRWDEVNRTRPVFGMGGVDAHAHIHKMLGGLIQVTVFRYKVQFKSVRTHLLLTKPISPQMSVTEAKQIIYDALLNCRVFVSNYFNGDARGFRCYAENTLGIAEIGEKLAFQDNTRLHVILPGGARNGALVRLIHNGNMIQEGNGSKVLFNLKEPGIYRVEVFRKKRAWIFTNHFRILRDT